MQHPGIHQLSPLDDENIAIVRPCMCSRPDANLIEMINKIGIASSQAQGLSHIITTFSAFMSDDGNKLYILLNEEHDTILGFLKIGPRHLFMWDHSGIQHEMNITCLLDFFTYQVCQRKGYGKKLIDYMLLTEGLSMEQIPIDRPSHLCLSFMKKHFGLKDFVPQNNKFVVFDQFWTAERQEEQNPSPKKEPHTPVKVSKPMAELSNYHPQLPRTPAKRAGLNPITWQPYD